MKTRLAFSPDELRFLVEQEKIPENLHSCNLVLSVRVVRDIINYIENSEFPTSGKLPAVLTCIDPRLKKATIMHLTCGQIKRQMLTYSKRAQKEEAVWDMILPCLEIKDSEYVGETCDKHGITRTVLDGRASLPAIPVLTNRIVLELRAFRIATDSTWVTMATWLQNLGEKKVCPPSLRMSVEALQHRRAELGRSKFLIHDGNVYRDVEQLLEEPYTCPEVVTSNDGQARARGKGPHKKVLKRRLRRTKAKERSVRAEQVVEKRHTSDAVQEAPKENIVNDCEDGGPLCKLVRHSRGQQSAK
ncbi:uncharacterized protein LOC118414973 [Branchiostoma floridae]|uniref:Uncharacterized protein LOC118414973 n=1 Tax=Branchiostoma floridae TaxID=7739 RepID=A0A9J7MP21_BRAFL|nr:uncharacterized protein LOC118414973 [Branchiostoma floridae]